MEKNTESECTSALKCGRPAKTLFLAPVYVRGDPNRRAPADNTPVVADSTPSKSQVVLPPLSNKKMSRVNCETSTQTSKTIIQLAKLEELQETMQKGLENIEEHYSVDSLNAEPERDEGNALPTTPEQRLIEAQAEQELRDTKDERLQQWVEQIKRANQEELNGMNEYFHHIRVNTPLGQKSRFSLSTTQNSTAPKVRVLSTSHITSFHNLINLRENDVEENEQAARAPSSHTPALTDKSTIDLVATKLEERSQSLSEDTPVPQARRQPKLEIWHSQVQHGPSKHPRRRRTPVMGDFDELISLHGDIPLDDDGVAIPWTTASLHHPITSSKPSCFNNLRSQSLVECKKEPLPAVNAPYKKITRCDDAVKIFGKNPRSPHTTGDFQKLNATPSATASHYFIAPMTAPTKTPCSTSNNPAGFKKCETSSFMSPTLSSEQKSLRQQVESVKLLMGSKFKTRAPSPAKHTLFTPGKNAARNLRPRAVRSEELTRSQANSKDFHEVKISGVYSSSTLYDSSTSCDNGIFMVLNRIKSQDFNVALKGLAEIIDTARTTSPEMMMPYMTLINQRLLELLKSPRSHVARTACQLGGHFFEVMKDTRRPEFDDIVNTLLYKTADANKFIRQDANMALDSMVTHIPTFHAVRSVCSKGPTHRNPLVRCAAVRLIICAIVIAGPRAVMHQPHHDATRKRIIDNLIHFLDDKNGETRKYAERLYKILHKEGTFDYYVKRYLNRTKLDALMAALKFVNKNSS